LEYSVETGIMKVRIDEEPTEHIIDHVHSPTGKLLECWDLFVGAEIDVFGKPT
jgi:hypothetical protein